MSLWSNLIICFTDKSDKNIFNYLVFNCLNFDVWTFQNILTRKVFVCKFFVFLENVLNKLLDVAKTIISKWTSASSYKNTILKFSLDMRIVVENDWILPTHKSFNSILHIFSSILQPFVCMTSQFVVVIMCF